MRKVFVIVIALWTSVFTSAGFAEEIFFEGEGYITPSRQSQVPYEPPASSKHYRSAGDTVIVNPLASRFPDIFLYTTVLDSNGDPVMGLTEKDFSVKEQSIDETSAVTQTIKRFIPSGENDSSRIFFSLVFDLSGSMSGSRLAEAQAAANSFINNIKENDRGSLVTFSSGGTERIVMPSDGVTIDSDVNGTYDIIDAVNSLTTSGKTAVYDGTAKGIESLSQEPSPKAVIVFTDGNTNNDISYNINTVIAKANNEGVPVYTIGLGIDPQNLKDIASATGGLYYYAPTAQDMTAIYNDIARNIRNQYVIGYTTHNPTFDGTTRKVTVTYTGTDGTGIYVVNSKPVITLDTVTSQFVSQSQEQGKDLIISGTVNDLDAHSSGQSLLLTLFYRHILAENYTGVSLPLTAQGNGVYAFSGTIPGATAVQEPAVQYYIHATDGIQETYLPFNYNKLPYSLTVLPNHGPEIIHTAIDSFSENEPIDISARVTDSDSGDSVSSVVLYYRPYDPNQNTPYIPIQMTSSDNVDYSARIPADKVTNTGLEYFISAEDSFNARTDFGTSAAPFTVAPADTDTDGDGITDSNDACPHDPNKTDDPGICGCGTEDIDSDNNGIMDCEEVSDDDDTCFIISSENRTSLLYNKMVSIILGIYSLFSAGIFIVMRIKS